ncbi:MAG: biopolymer transporter ExbD [Gemmatimonadales bacterium]
MAWGVGQGGGLRGHGELPLSADINVTSLVDVAFVLLIIFMITAPIMQGGVEVELPKAEARPIAAKEGMVVSVNQGGAIFIDDTRVSLGDFRMTFGAMVRSRKPKSVYLRADRRVPYGNVVEVLAVIRTSGITNVGLVAEAEERP